MTQIAMIKKLLLYFSVLSCLSGLSQNQKQITVGLALSGGGAKGLAHVGVIKVLEEAGIRFDYITGTSMGGIVGGLYAIGYNADSIESITTSINWDYMINDNIERKDLSIEEKANYQKYILTLPVKKRKIYLPKGMHEGQNISLRLTDLTRHVHNITDFNKFDIPFACVAANIEKGKSEVLNSGFLAEAMQASMAIPSVFSPVEINENLYIDGGLLNNFPVKEVKAMGADIVIGVDVQSRLLTKDEITSPIKIFGQASKILRAKANEDARTQCDILIRPDVSEHAVMDFDHYDDILAIGEATGRAILPEIIALFDSLNIPIDKIKKKSFSSVKDSVHIDSIVVNGIDNTKKLRAFRKKLKVKPNNTVSYKLIKEDINKAYGSLNFDKVVYKVSPLNDKNILTINAKEKSVRKIKVGVHYDPDLKTGLLINYTSNDLFINGLKLQLDGVVSENPRAKMKFLFNSNGLLNPEVNLKLMMLKLKYYEDSKPLISYNSTYYEGSFFLNSNLYNNLRIGGGVELVHTSFSTDVSFDELETLYENFVNLVGRLEFDSWNKTYYATKGLVIKTNARLLYGENYEPSLAINARYEPLFQLHPNFSIQPKVIGGGIWTDNEPLWYAYKIGGTFPWYNSSFVPFVGYHFTEMMNSAYLVARMDLQYEFIKNHYFIFKANALKHDINPERLIDFSNYDPLYGYGLTYGINTIIGPIEISGSYNNQQDFLMYFNLGFWF